MKKLFLTLPLALILCFMVGCQDKEAMVELEAMQAQAEVEENNIEITKRWLKEMDIGNLAIFDEICTEDYKCHLPWSSKPLNREVHKQVIKVNLVAFPDYNHTVEDIIAKGDKVVVKVTNRGTHKGDFDGMSPTGKEIEFSVISIVRFVDGKAAEMWADFDSLVLYQQLGRELKPFNTSAILCLEASRGHRPIRPVSSGHLPGYLNFQICGLLDNKDIDKLLLHFKNIFFKILHAV